MEERRIYIRVPSSRMFLVMCDGKEAENWRDLMGEARQAVEQAVRERWYKHRQHEMMMVIQALEPNAALDEVMGFVCNPSMEYPCPEALAAKARF